MQPNHCYVCTYVQYIRMYLTTTCFARYIRMYVRMYVHGLRNARFVCLNLQLLYYKYTIKNVFRIIYVYIYIIHNSRSTYSRYYVHVNIITGTFIGTCVLRTYTCTYTQSNLSITNYLRTAEKD